MDEQWTREQVISHILDLEAAGKPLYARANGVRSPLYGASRRLFGSWGNALRAAGIPANRLYGNGRWSPGKICVMINHLAKRQRALTLAQIQERYPGLAHAARRVYGSWTKAVLTAGVDPLKLRRVPTWNSARVMEHILLRSLRNESLVARLVEPASLVAAGKRLFGSWAAAVGAAGLDADATHMAPRRKTSRKGGPDCATAIPRKLAPRRHWTRQDVLDAIRDRLASNRGVNALAVAKDQAGLYRAGRKLFGGWSIALRAAMGQSIQPGAHDSPVQ